MLLGIDVGGTSTDGVLIKNGALEKSVKKPSRIDALTATILEVLDELLEGRDPGAVQRLVISTTLVTNLLATQSGARTALLLIPGRGLPFSFYQEGPGRPCCLSPAGGSLSAFTRLPRIPIFCRAT